eukprot:8850370-Pyramimonas_sp.AAC.2
MDVEADDDDGRQLQVGQEATDGALKIFEKGQVGVLLMYPRTEPKVQHQHAYAREPEKKEGKLGPRIAFAALSLEIVMILLTRTELDTLHRDNTASRLDILVPTRHISTRHWIPPQVQIAETPQAVEHPRRNARDIVKTQAQKCESLQAVERSGRNTRDLVVSQVQRC